MGFQNTFSNKSSLAHIIYEDRRTTLFFNLSSSFSGMNSFNIIHGLITYFSSFDLLFASD